MGEFKIIETQEELNRIISERLTREKEKYSDYDQLKIDNENLTTQVSKLNQTLLDKESEISGFTGQLEELQGKVKNYELTSLKTTVALKNGIPYDLASRLVGEDEDSLNKDAQNLAKMISKNEQNFVAPLKSTEPKEGGKTEAYRSLLNELITEGD